MVFIDTSFYFALLNPQDSLHSKALNLAKKHGHAQKFTSNSILGELATVGSQRFSKKLTTEYLDIIRTDSHTQTILETPKTVNLSWQIFSSVKNKDISWVDCFSIAIIKTHQIPTALTFDQDFRKVAKKLNLSLKIL